jgi:hypothetical protein
MASNRKNTRRNRRNTRRNTRRNRRCWSRKSWNRRNNMMGGADMSPANVKDSLAGSGPSQMNLAQGDQYASFHRNQHGGQAPFPGGVTNSLLDESLRASARVLPTDQYIRDVAGLRDPGTDGMMGGRRKRKTASKRKGRKGRKGTKGRKGRKQRGGGAVYNPTPASTAAPGLLLSPDMEAKAIRGMNPEWYLAENPNSFAPKM